MERIVVTASRTEESSGATTRDIEIITSEDIETLQAKDVSDVLTHYNFINISNYGGPGATKTIRMRGSTASQVLVLIDNRPVNSPRDGEVDLSTIPLDNIERIEVMRGPASSLYGSSAMGGTIHIITKQPPQEGSSTEVLSSFGTFRTYQERLTHGQRINKFGYRFSGGYISAEGFRDNSALSAKDSSVKMEYDITDNQKISLNTGFYTSLIGTPGLVTSPDIDDKQRTRKNFIDLNWKLELNPDTQLSAKAYNNYDRLEFSENTAGSIFDTAFKKDIHTTQVRGFDIQANRWVTERWRVLGGYNHVYNFNNSTTAAKHRYTVNSGYLDNEFTLTEKLKTRLGTRLDHYSNFGFQTSPSASALYALNDNNKLRGLISRSFRAPTFNDLYWPDEGWAKGNPNLKPEKGIMGEVGWETSFDNPRAGTNLTYFRSFYEQLIQWAEAAGVWSPTNVGSAVIEGVEIEGYLSPMESVDITLGYTYQAAKDDKTNKFLIYQPKHKVDFSISHQDILGWTVGIKGQWTGLRFHDAANTVKIDGFFLLDIYASKKWRSGLTYYIVIHNALNKKYESVQNYPAPGFAVTNGIKFEF